MPRTKRESRGAMAGSTSKTEISRAVETGRRSGRSYGARHSVTSIRTTQDGALTPATRTDRPGERADGASVRHVRLHQALVCTRDERRGIPELGFMLFQRPCSNSVRPAVAFIKEYEHLLEKLPVDVVVTDDVRSGEQFAIRGHYASVGLDHRREFLVRANESAQPAAIV